MSAENPARDAASALLVATSGTDPASLDLLVPMIYEELRALAHRQLARERDLTVQTTELVHEAYLRLVGDSRITARGRAYFFAAAARAMRQVLIDAARRRGASKRGANADPITLDDHHAVADAFSAELLDLEQALQRLEELNPRQVRIVECRYFGGMNVDETAEALEVSPRTVEYDFALARAFLYEQLKSWGRNAS